MVKRRAKKRKNPARRKRVARRRSPLLAMRRTTRKRKNPAKKRSVRKNAWYNERKSHAYVAKNKRPVPKAYRARYRSNPKRRRVYRRRRNPALTGKLLNQKFLMQAVLTALGMSVGFLSKPAINQVMPDKYKDSRWLGAVQLVGGMLLVGFVKNKNVKMVGGIVAAFGAYDLMAQYVLPDILPAIPANFKSGIQKFITKPVEEETSASYISSSYNATHAPVVSPQAQGIGASYQSVYPSRSGTLLGASYDVNSPLGYDYTDNPLSEIM